MFCAVQAALCPKRRERDFHYLTDDQRNPGGRLLSEVETAGPNPCLNDVQKSLVLPLLVPRLSFLFQGSLGPPSLGGGGGAGGCTPPPSCSPALRWRWGCPGLTPEEHRVARISVRKHALGILSRPRSQSSGMCSVTQLLTPLSTSLESAFHVPGPEYMEVNKVASSLSSQSQGRWSTRTQTDV